MLRAFPSAVIENLRPLIDGGRYPIKRVVDEDLVVEADVFKAGHDVVAAALKWRILGDSRWQETPMTHIDNDRWRGACTLYENAIYEYTVEAWTDTFRGWRDEFAKKFEAGVSALTSEALEGAALLEAAAQRAYDYNDAARLLELSQRIAAGDPRGDQRHCPFGGAGSAHGHVSGPFRRDAVLAAATGDCRSYDRADRRLV